MSLEQEIHSQWAGDTALIDLVPASRLFTEQATGEPTLPYVVIDAHRARPTLRASGDATVDRVELTFEIYTDDLKQTKAIAVALLERFDRAAFALSASVVLSMQANEYAEHLHDDGVWQLSARYTAVVERN